MSWPVRESNPQCRDYKSRALTDWAMRAEYCFILSTLIEFIASLQLHDKSWHYTSMILIINWTSWLRNIMYLLHIKDKVFVLCFSLTSFAMSFINVESSWTVHVQVFYKTTVKTNLYKHNERETMVMLTVFLRCATLKVFVTYGQLVFKNYI